MTKLEFLLSLQQKLSHLPKGELEEQLSFYSEMIEDRVEEGLSEAEAVAAVGSVDEIAAQAAAGNPAATSTAKKAKPKKGKEILLWVMGFPIWFPLLVSAFAVVLSLYISLWAVVISLWAVFVSLAACAPGFLVAGIALFLWRNKLAGIALIGGALVCAGLSIFLFFGCKAATKGTVLLFKVFFQKMKRCFSRKEAQ